jgi:uncharacterized membrane protein YedE/YeeE
LSDGVRRPYFVSPDDGHTLGALLVTVLGLKDRSSVTFPATVPMTVVAGLLVGAGTTLGSGCTSPDHGQRDGPGMASGVHPGLAAQLVRFVVHDPLRTFLVSRGVIG